MRPVLVIETDVFDDVDDVGAIAVAHALADRGFCEVRAVGVNTPARTGSLVVRAVNAFYGRPEIPVGVLLPADDSRTRSDYPRLVADQCPVPPLDPPPAPELLRRILDDAAPGEITLVSIGFHQNLVALLDQDGGADAVRRAVGSTVVMAGAFPEGDEFNLTQHPETARRFVAEWPVPIDFLGYEAGDRVVTAVGIDWPEVGRNPVAVAYDAFTAPAAGRPSWDLLAVDYAVRGTDGVWELSAPGRLELDERAHGICRDDPRGSHRYLRAVVPPEALATRLNSLLEARPRRGAPGSQG